MRLSVAIMWHSSNDAGKLEMLTHASNTGIPLSVKLLDEDVDILDKFAQMIGMMPIFETSVDEAGLRCLVQSVASPDVAGSYRKRSQNLQAHQ